MVKTVIQNAQMVVKYVLIETNAYNTQVITQEQFQTNCVIIHVLSVQAQQNLIALTVLLQPVFTTKKQ
ncbi:hypothetical protein TTHERM_000224519 (macronuclear) [Tetrahymena thermophila SB210]|uniref:Uncharacterized protein n=1 Tax=Tetrahymena thermophila (strain SB210) TaxID=312017 RepID=W7XDJ2_TETTS|nr:hypothetical protein TTHERM_000224519 [Tetrahymena thermophila SB210]EWS74713.1 hypothetical protein TTHERM_000224519 [Tetrahymena thermophila SB210]|eukprot:XP_012652714.1 hypothetical protein TTHERM_000224519 [Tetrahymena thermophila SB210]